MTQQPLFDAAAAEQAKRAGIAQVAGNNAAWLARARAVAREIAQREGKVTADDVRAVLYPRGDRPTHPNCWGAVFLKGFHFTGERRKSRVPEGHRNEQKVWTCTSSP